MESYAAYILLGLVAGALSGLIGIGGGIIIVPALVFLFGMTQHHAQGTTLALLIPPIGLLAALTYYKAGYVDVRVAVLIAIGFFAGSYLGAKISTGVTDAALGRIFGVALILIGIKMVLGR
ncbi:MAG TPA: sulfite exporter TauE/SafE family protein [Bacteroidota bacterium]|nr:sulfite exporter TauE/SafE family protein [Bacteroidota bacterium]